MLNKLDRRASAGKKPQIRIRCKFPCRLDTIIQRNFNMWRAVFIFALYPINMLSIYLMDGFCTNHMLKSRKIFDRTSIYICIALNMMIVFSGLPKLNIPEKTYGTAHNLTLLPLHLSKVRYSIWRPVRKVNYGRMRNYITSLRRDWSQCGPQFVTK